MKAITLYQPWATLVAIGAKKIETRSWFHDYRGPLAIHAGKNKKFVNARSQDYICHQEPFHSTLIAAGMIWQFGPFPLGEIVATCELVNVVQFGCLSIYADPTGKDLTIQKYDCPDGWIQIPPDGTKEYKFGDYTPGRFAWILTNIKIIKDPIPAKGSLGLWDWEPPKGFSL